jgi:hypothetical protein
MEQGKWLLLGQDPARSNIKAIGWLFIIGAYLNMNCIDYVGEKLATKLFFYFISLGFIFLSFSEFNSPKYRWFFRAVFECSVYSLFDEIIGRACVIDWWEVVGAIITFVCNFLYEYRTPTRKYISHAIRHFRS